MQGRGRKGKFFLVVVAAQLDIDLDLPDAVSFAYLNPTSLHWPVNGRTLSPATWRHGLLVCHVRFLRSGCAHFRAASRPSASFRSLSEIARNSVRPA